MSKSLTSLLIGAAAIAITGAAAADTAKQEKCYGVVKAGKNDCKGGTVATCAGQSTKDGQGFIILPKGVCEKLAGGSLIEKK